MGFNAFSVINFTKINANLTCFSVDKRRNCDVSKVLTVVTDKFFNRTENLCVLRSIITPKFFCGIQQNYPVCFVESYSIFVIFNRISIRP